MAMVAMDGCRGRVQSRRWDERCERWNFGRELEEGWGGQEGGECVALEWRRGGDEWGSG